jgi:S-adenosylmethionine hydrolase
MRAPLISLLTDFGCRDWYVGAMKAVLASLAPGVPIVDLSHGVPAHGVAAGAFVLERNRAHFPDGTVHLCVVDPGVGSARAAVALRADGQYFVGPDNGLFGTLASAEDLEVVELDPLGVTEGTPSTTFHGRDLFAPAAARLARGEALAGLGPSAEGLEPVVPWWREIEGGLSAPILWVDHFGNCITGLPRSALDRMGFAPVVEVGGRSLLGLQETFSDVPRGEPLAYVGSSDTLEIAVREGHGARSLGVGVGDEVRVRPA